MKLKPGDIIAQACGTVAHQIITVAPPYCTGKNIHNTEPAWPSYLISNLTKNGYVIAYRGLKVKRPRRAPVKFGRFRA